MIRYNKRAKYYEFDYKDIFGNRKTKGGFKRKVDAESFRIEILAEISKGGQLQDKKMTFQKASELFLELHAIPRCRPTTVYHYKGYLKNHILPCFGHLKLIEINSIMIKQFLCDKTKTDLANSTINKFKKLMGAIFNMMIEDGIINHNPAARIKSLKETPNIEIDPLNQEEVKAFLNKTKEVYPDFYTLAFTAIYTGMRQGELLALTWSDINWKTNKIIVSKSYTHGRLGETKTGKTRRIDMSPKLAKVLKEWKLACPVNSQNIVFPNSNGEYQDANNMLKRRYYFALGRAGLHKRRFHDLRHTYATLSLLNSIPMKYVQSQLGHSSIKMTMDTYTHLLPEVNEQCVAMLDSIMECNEVKTDILTENKSMLVLGQKP